jgi:hypothetical protein
MNGVSEGRERPSMILALLFRDEIVYEWFRREERRVSPGSVETPT